jgi:hypothetical protein
MTNLSISQDKILTGQVIDRNLEPLGNASITTVYNQFLTNADKDGIFQLERFDELSEILVQFIGKRTERITIDKMCHINVIMFDEVHAEFKSKRQEDMYFNKQRKRIKHKYRQALKEGLLQEEQKCE